MDNFQENIDDIFVSAEAGDNITKLLKMMQRRDGRKNECGIIELQEDSYYGVTKEDAAAQLGNISTKTIQDMISRIDPTRAQNRKLPELTIAGQPIHVDIKEVKVAGDRRPHYFTPESINPVFLQMNISQVGTLLTGLAREYFEGGNNFALGIGKYIYIQLSEYAKDRIIKVFGERSELLLGFMDEIEECDEEKTLLSFRSEGELLSSGELSYGDRLCLIIKNGTKCNLKINTDNGTAIIKDVRLNMFEDKIIATSDVGEKVELHEDQIVDVCEA